MEINNKAEDENKRVALGICFGAGVGIAVGAIINNVLLGMSLGGALGIIVATILNLIYRKKLS